MSNKIIVLVMIITTGLTSCASERNKTTPTDKRATAETANLYNRLFALAEKGIMVAHQDDMAYGHGWYKMTGRSDVKEVTGNYPAVIGWELGHVEIGADHNLDSVYFSDMKDYIRETYKRGGITTVSWHGNNIVTGGSAWDCAQDSVVTTILPGGSNHEKYLLWLDRVGDFFLDLKGDDGKLIPVVFRMYHEHTGHWFWWCAVQCTPEEYKNLWIMTVDYLRDKKNVHNLLYAYSPAAVKDGVEYSERYPGDEYVDIVGFDCYASPNELENYMREMDLNLRIVTDFAAQRGKIAIVAETGLESVADNTYFTETVYPVVSKYNVSWILFWRNAYEADKPNHYYVPYDGHPAAGDFRSFAQKSNILMCNDIQD